MSTSNQATKQEDEAKPLWRYVSKLRKTVIGGNFEIKCNICEVPFNGSYTRVRAHLLNFSGVGVRVCSKVTP
ncbi:hypothetical protein JHK82_027621 [Glycine max]|uniref:BED-type domain-containing protein n=1 Tax=Glycine max TaxID=3847 RepID=A0A0R0HRM4_SOYBN|nr:hypothetical protein JHK87_027510 [Glycine soja]KAG4996828.1 hypothetical protein JHK85_028267 [Glycine max]KAG5003610.1 hypothetical protein JHK86_027749 [Glycine max]KAG5126786.1 hypothetical protein JHK82_027621 [Glycine max]KAG5151394.1 hypothetical protein JHK84_027866 [Glycine max]